MSGYWNNRCTKRFNFYIGPAVKVGGLHEKELLNFQLDEPS
jgi:hypothetical protein